MALKAVERRVEAWPVLPRFLQLFAFEMLYFGMISLECDADVCLYILLYSLTVLYSACTVEDGN